MSCKKSNGVLIGTTEKVDFNFDVKPILSDRCFKCHGPDQNALEAGLRLDIKEHALSELQENPGKYAIVPFNTDSSELVYRIFSDDSTLLMPPPESNLELTDQEKNILKNWIEQGAEFKEHWSFIPPEKPSNLPKVDNQWAINPIDHFVYNKMKSRGLKPSKKAEKAQLLKRVSLDLTGLPPSLEMMDRFLGNELEISYEELVDELLASEHYGEKMAIPWLDAARYADSHGYQDDGLRTMWPWRDWVIHAFNENYSYKQFVTWQLAGDIMAKQNPDEPKGKEQMLATGFNRNHKITQEGGVIDEEYRVEYVTDRTNTFGKTMLAMTFECAKCHDHKYDPISQKDYFSTFAFFNQVPEKGIFGTIDASFADPPNMEITDEEAASILAFINKKDSVKLEVMVMSDSLGLRNTYVLNRGNYDSHGEQVSYNVPASILPFDTTIYSADRLGLSEWLFDERNPLTARVFVNRIWAQFFGRGIVPTTGDFGLQGDLPSHPQLLDWLAVDFMEHDWDIKWLVKEIVTSATYQQSAEIDEHHYTIDPDNVYLSRSSRLRLPAEHVRDMVLFSSGMLNPEIGGPSVKPYQPPGLWEAATSGRGTLRKYIQDEGQDLYRRGMYTFIKRTVPPPSMLIFDASNRDQCEVSRPVTNTPLQALVMMNDPQVIEASKYLASNLLKSNQEKPEESISISFKRIVCRPIESKELEILKEYYKSELDYFLTQPEKTEAFVALGDYAFEEMDRKEEWAALSQTILLIYNMEEVIMRT